MDSFYKRNGAHLNFAWMKAGDDAAQAQWFDIEELPSNMAFDHDEVVRFAIKELKRKNGIKTNNT